MNENVIPASPTTLITLLRTVQFGWRQARIAERAEEIRKLGQELYDRLRVLAGHLQKVGHSLTGATSAYNDAVRGFETRALVTARKFAELGPVEVRVRKVEPTTQTDVP